MQHTGNFSTGSLTTLLVLDTEKEQLLFAKVAQSLRTNLESLADQIVSFEPEELHFRKHLPKIQMRRAAEDGSSPW